MYPTLYHALHDLLGLDVQSLKLINTFGFMVALAFLAAAKTLSLELGRRHALGLIPRTRRRAEPQRPTTPLDLLLSGALAFLIGYKLLGVALGEYSLQGGADTQRYLLSSKGHLWGGIVCGLGWIAFRFRELRASRESSEKQPEEPVLVDVTPQEHTMGITGAAALGGLIGAKLFHFLERPRSILDFIENPSLGALFSGLTIYGGLIFGALFVYRYCRKHGLPFAQLCDATAPGLMLAYGVGRLGCHLSGDGDWGVASASQAPSFLAWLPDWLWSYDYPNNVLGSGVPLPEGGYPGYGTHLVPAVYPTALYEALTAFALFGVLWSLRKRLQQPLLLFGIYLMMNGFARFWIEKIRVNATYDLFGVEATQAELLAVVMFVGGAFLVWRQRRAVPRPFPTAPAPE